MKCPRCKTTPEDENALYCLTCGKQLKRDDAFDGEFEEDFCFDEEREEKESIARERERLLRREKRLRALYVLLGTILIASFVFCVLWFTLPRDGIHDAQKEPSFEHGAQTAPDLSEQEEDALTLTVHRLLIASTETYDPDTLLSLCPQGLREAKLQSLLKEYACDNEAELRACLAAQKERAPSISGIDASIADVSEEEEYRELYNALREKYGEALGDADALYLANVFYTEKANGESAVRHKVFLLGKFDTSFYSLDF